MLTMRHYRIGIRGRVILLLRVVAALDMDQPEMQCINRLNLLYDLNL